MLLNHLAAVFFFAGPLFYLGLWMLLDPAAVAGVIAMIARAFHREHKAIPQHVRAGVRWAGVLLVLLAIAM